MSEIAFFRLFNVVVGVVGIAVGLGVMLVPHFISKIEKRLDRTFSIERLQTVLNKRRNLSEALIKHPLIFGLILLVVSFLLLVSSMAFF